MKKQIFYATLVAAMMSFQACENFGDDPFGGNNAEDYEGVINGHEYVDLGTSVKWAKCNVGAATPEDEGTFYAWGEIETKATFTWENSVTYDNAAVGSNIAGDSTYDVARAKWGDNWRMPTKAEMEELMSVCTYEWTTQNGVKGCLFTSTRNGMSIFLPAAGYRWEAEFEDDDEAGYYWSATAPVDTYHNLAWYFKFNKEDASTRDFDRSFGYLIRPVIR